jgi:hypothetical protein
MHHYHHGGYSIDNVESQEGDSEKDQDLSGLLIHSIQPSDDDDF